MHTPGELNPWEQVDETTTKNENGMGARNIYMYLRTITRGPQREKRQKHTNTNLKI